MKVDELKKAIRESGFNTKQQETLNHIADEVDAAKRAAAEAAKKKK